MRTGFLLLALLAFAPVPGAAADPTCDKVTWENCTVGEVYNEVYGSEVEAPIAAVAENAKVATDKARVAPNATTPPATFASRIHSSYEDYLKLLAFAVNDVEESDDGKAFIVRFNPIRTGAHRLGLSLTVTEPQIGEEVVSAISEDGRSDTVSLLEKQVDDLDDLTFSAGYTLLTTDCQLDSRAGRCYGRDPASYLRVLSALIPESAMPEGDAAFDLARTLSELVPSNDSTAPVLGRALAANREGRSRQVEAIAGLARQDARGTKETAQQLAAAGADLFWPLIDNQPQLAVTVSAREAGALIGQSSASLSLELQFGATNLNKLFRGCALKDGGCASRRLAELASKKAKPGLKLVDGKFVLTASYTEREAFSLAELPLPDAPGSFEAVAIPKSNEFRAKLQWGARLANRIDGWTPRLDLSAEGLEAEDDGLHTTSRWVAAATVTLPVSEEVTIPLSINWANKPEYLGESDASFGAHVGLSFSLDRKPSE